jgi:protein subunit release factor A
MPEIDEVVDYDLDHKDIEMDIFGASSAGGQNANRNKT